MIGSHSSVNDKELPVKEHKKKYKNGPVFRQRQRHAMASDPQVMGSAENLHKFDIAQAQKPLNRPVLHQMNATPLFVQRFPTKHAPVMISQQLSHGRRHSLWQHYRASSSRTYKHALLHVGPGHYGRSRKKESRSFRLLANSRRVERRKTRPSSGGWQHSLTHGALALVVQ